MAVHSPACQRYLDELMHAPEGTPEHTLAEHFSALDDAQIRDEVIEYVTEYPAATPHVRVGLHLWAVMAEDFRAEVVAIDDAREAAFAVLREANERGLTGAGAEAMSAAMADVDARCEVLRRKYFPQWKELTVALGAVSVVDAHGRVEWVCVRPAGEAVQR